MKYPYPLTIVLDRYHGVYSGGRFTAWKVYHDNIPGDIDADDVTCAEFWEYRAWEYGPVGKGDTPTQAIQDLNRQLKEIK